jgi:hypothetical protein
MKRSLFFHHSHFHRSAIALAPDLVAIANRKPSIISRNGKNLLHWESGVATTNSAIAFLLRRRSLFGCDGDERRLGLVKEMRSGFIGSAICLRQRNAIASLTPTPTSS